MVTVVLSTSEKGPVRASGVWKLEYLFTTKVTAWINISVKSHKNSANFLRNKATPVKFFHFLKEFGSAVAVVY